MCLFGIEFIDWILPNIQMKKSITAFIINETVRQIGSQHFSLWFCIEEPIHSSVLGIYISEKKEICLLLKSLLDLLYQYIETILYILMVERGITKDRT